MGKSSQHKGNDTPPSSAVLLFMLVAFAAVIVLATQLGNELKWAPRRSLFSQPGFWSAMAIIGMLVFGFLQLIVFSVKNRPFHKAEAVAEVITWSKSIEYVCWFLLYVFIVPKLGYVLTTIIFCWSLTYRLGYRNYKMQGISVATAIAIVVIFKSFLAVKIPGGMVYEYLPDAMRNFMIIYL